MDYLLNFSDPLKTIAHLGMVLGIVLVVGSLIWSLCTKKKNEDHNN